MAAGMATCGHNVASEKVAGDDEFTGSMYLTSFVINYVERGPVATSEGWFNLWQLLRPDSKIF